MSFFKSIFGQSDEDDQEIRDDYEYDDVNDSDDYNSYDNDEDDYDYTDSSSSDSSEKYYSIAKVRVQGFDKLDEDDKEYIMNDLEEDTHVYLRNVFDDPKDCHTLQVLRHDHIIGYIDSKKEELVHSYLRNGKIGAIVVSKITSKDFKTIVDLNIYYEDAHGEEYLPYYPLEGRQLSVIETDKWTGQEDWSEEWQHLFGTDELSYRFNEMFDDSVDDSEKTMVDVWFSSFMQNYLDGSCITEKGASHYLDYLNTDCAKKVLKKRIYSFMESKGFHFADKELFADEEEESEEVVTDNEDGTIVTDRGFNIPAKFQKFNATVEATDDAIDFFEEDGWQENDVPIVMASIIPGDEIEAINLDTQELYFTYKCEKIRSKMEEGNYAIIIVTDYKIKGDIIEVELYAQFSEKEAESSYGEVVKQYEPTYELAYIDGQGHPQRKTIKNANMNSFVAGIKFRENYEEMLSKLEEGMELQIKPEPDNEYDPDALAVYHDDDHLGYIPKKDIPAVSLNMEN